MIKVSVITPAYNAEKYISRCIKSVLQQSLKEIELIIVDDGSTDRTGVICDDISKLNANVTIIHKKNEGVSKARNEAIKIAKGEYILFADADDWLDSNMCNKMYQLATKKNLDIVISEYYNYYENSNKLERINLTKYDNKKFSELITNDGNGYGGFPWNKLIRRDKIKEYFNEEIHYYENLLFFLQNFNGNISYDVIFEPLYYYCINDNSAVHSKKFNIKRISALNALEKIIPLVPNEFTDAHKVVFITNYNICWFGLKSEKMNLELLNKFKNNKNKYLKDILKSSKIDIKSKVKLLVINYLRGIYYIVKKIK